MHDFSRFFRNLWERWWKHVVPKLPRLVANSNATAQIPLGSSRHVSTRLDTFDVSSESRRACRVVTRQVEFGPIRSCSTVQSSPTAVRH